MNDEKEQNNFCFVLFLPKEVLNTSAIYSPFTLRLFSVVTEKLFLLFHMSPPLAVNRSFQAMFYFNKEMELLKKYRKMNQLYGISVRNVDPYWFLLLACGRPLIPRQSSFGHSVSFHSHLKRLESHSSRCLSIGSYLWLCSLRRLTGRDCRRNQWTDAFTLFFGPENKTNVKKKDDAGSGGSRL